MCKYVPFSDLEKDLNRFRNTKDNDIEDFIRHKAISYEKRHWCSVYLLVNTEQLIQEKGIFVEGYFTLSHKVFLLQDNVSNNVRKKLFNGVMKDDDYLHTVLIGQLGKYIDQGNCECSDITMGDLLDKAINIITYADTLIPCRCVLLECRDYHEEESDFEDRKKLHSKYIDYGFKAIQKSEDLIQYVKRISAE